MKLRQIGIACPSALKHRLNEATENWESLVLYVLLSTAWTKPWKYWNRLFICFETLLE